MTKPKQIYHYKIWGKMALHFPSLEAFMVVHWLAIPSEKYNL